MDDIKTSAEAPEASEPELTAEERTKKLLTVICICKGINLGRVLKGIDGCQTVEDVNRKTGCGSGGCKGQRCGPRVKILLKKYKEKKDAERK